MSDLERKSELTSAAVFTEYEIEVPFGKSSYTVYLQDKFPENAVSTPFAHLHSVAEINVFAARPAQMEINGEPLHVNPWEAVFVPAGCYHELINHGEAYDRFTFCINLPWTEVKTKRMPCELILGLMREAYECRNTDNFFNVSYYISFIIASLSEGLSLAAKRTNAPAYVIREFFTRNYQKDVHLYDLAEMLNISEKHAARLVEKHTGKSFTNELTHQRILVAERLMKDSTHSLNEIASLVGFRSYSGFWKAYNRHSSEKLPEPSEQKISAKA